MSTKIRIICIGKKPAVHFQPAISFYENRLAPQLLIDWIYLPHTELNPKHEADIERIRNQESQNILEKLAHQQPNSYTILLDEKGQNFDSPQLAKHLQTQFDHGCAQLVFIIGGSYGVNSQVRSQTNLVWSLSRLVFPHQLVRVVLLEQIYRSQMIQAGKKYHHS